MTDDEELRKLLEEQQVERSATKEEGKRGQDGSGVVSEEMEMEDVQESDAICKFNSHQKVRLAKTEKAIQQVVKNIKNATKVSEIQIRCMLKEMVERIETITLTVEKREQLIGILISEKESMKEIINALQVHERHVTADVKSTQPPTQNVQEDFMENIQWKQMVQDNNLLTVSTLTEFLMEKYENEIQLAKMKEAAEILTLEEQKAQKQTKETHAKMEKMNDDFQKAQKQVADLQARLVDYQQEVVKRTKQVAGLKVKIQQLEEAKEYRANEAESNCFAQRSKNQSAPTRNNETTFQHTEDGCTSQNYGRQTRLHWCSGKYGDEEERVEGVRAYCSETEEILEERSESEGFENNTPQRRTGNYQPHHTYAHTVQHHLPVAHGQREVSYADALFQQSIPEPEKFSGAEKTISIRSFTMAFQMKYGHFEEYQKVILLESKFLKGKALQAFKGLSAREKLSVGSIMNALAIRLRVSTEDMARVAKMKWEKLNIREDQSLEDFCLEIDERAEAAYKRVCGVELSSINVTKLLEALGKRDRTMKCVIDAALMGIPEVEHYEEARKLVVHNEVGNGGQEKWQKNSGMKDNMTSQKANDNSFKNTNFARTHNNWNRNSLPPRQSQNNSEQSADGNMNWRQPQNTQQANGNGYNGTARNTQNSWNMNTQRCHACNEVGCHAPTCPKAPKSNASRTFTNNVTCYKCGGLGHYASSCVQTTENQKEATQTTPSNSVAVLDKDALIPKIEETKVTETRKPETLHTLNIDTHIDSAEEREKVRVERCRMGKATVDIVIDSGACISMISKRTWDDIVKVNGEQWEKEVKLESSDMEAVYAANSQPIQLLFKVTVETAMKSRTREISYYVADVERDSIILGINQFGKMGIQVSMEETPRDIKLIRNEKISPGRSKVVKVSVEGVVKEEESHCLISPLISCLPPSVCQVSKSGEAFVKLVNCTTEVIVLEKGHKIAQGELENFEVVQEKAERLRIIGEVCEKAKAMQTATVRTDRTLCTVDKMVGNEEHWEQVCQQLKKSKDMPPSEEEVWKVIKNFQHLFAIDDMELGRTNVVECEIEVMEGVQPIRQRPRPIPMSIRPEIRKMLEKMVMQGVIRESKSPWSSPVVLVKKKDGTVRMCIDYRKVNKVIKNNAHPLPHIEATLQSLAGKKYFTTLDMLAGYWQVPVQEECKQVTAFAVGSELYEWNVLPFGLTTSPAIFQAAMETIVGDSLGDSAFVYVDDLLIASSTLQEHVNDVERILRKIEKSGMKLKASKCHIAQTEVEYLGHKITPDGVSTEKTKVEKMEKYSRPSNAKELHSFLGLIGYYRKFIINFAMLAAHLTPFTSKKVEWKWGEEQETAFQNLKNAICTAPVLMQPKVEAAMDGSRPFFVFTDASRLGVGAVLSQEGEDKEQHPIAFASKALSKAETRYHITDLEALAMMFALKRFKTIIYGTKVIVCTDHKPLMYILNGAPLADRLLRWSLDLLEYDVKIVYIAGQANKVADALSRGGCATVDIEEPETVEMSRIVGEISEEEQSSKDYLDTKLWDQWLRKEEGWKEVIRRLESGEVEGKVKLPGVKGEILLENYALIGTSLRNVEDEKCNRLVVPQVAIRKVISEAHEGALAGHFGTEKVFRQLRKIFFWPKMRVSIENFVKACAKCVCTNDYPKLTAPLTPYKTSYPLEIVAIDLIDMGLSTQGNRYILTIIDLFTKYGIGVPIPDKKAETVLRAFVERWAVGEGRVPNKLLTDQGKEFVNQYFKQFTDMLKIEHITTKGYDSRANGAVERFNKTLVHTMKKKMTVPYEWDDQIPFAVYAYNSVAHRTTGESPMFLFQGRDPRGPLEMVGDDAVGSKYADMDEYKNLMSQELLKAHKIAKEHADQECEMYKKLFDAKHHTAEKTYPVPGSRVLVEIPAEKLGARCPKLINKWKGPYRVVACTNNSATLVPVLGKSRETLQIPFDKLRIIPTQMGNDPIATKKGRAGVRENEARCDGIGEETTTNDNDEYFFREIFVCRCPTPCRFLIPNTSKFKPGLITTSPTQYVRMCMLAKLNPELIKDPDTLQLLSLNPLPLREKPPSDIAWKAMSHCGTLALIAEDVPGWKLSLLNFQQRAMEKYLSEEVTNPERVTLVLCPGVNPKQAPLTNVYTQQLTDIDQLADNVDLFDDPTLVVCCVPFSCDEDDNEGWQSLVDLIPAEVFCVLLPAPGKVHDYSLIPVVSQNLKGITRKNGSWCTLTPEDLVPAESNKSLALIGDTKSPESYWTVVKGLLDKQNVQWRRFGIQEKERLTAGKTPEKHVTRTGGSGLEESNQKRKRYYQ